LLILLLLTAAALDPVIHYRHQPARCVAIIDHSGSMNAFVLNSKTTRLDTAKQQFRANISGRDTAVIAAGHVPQIVCGFTHNAAALIRAADSIEPTTEGTDISKAIELAEELIANEPDSRIVIYTDGCFPQTADAANRVFIPIGQPADNTAVTAFQTRRTFDGSAGYEIMVTAENFGTAAVESVLKVERQNGKIWDIVDAIPVKLEPNKPVTKIVSGIAVTGGTFRGILPIDDILPQDNMATAVLPDYPKMTVYLYGTENFFLQQALQVQPNTDIQWITEIPPELPPNGLLVIHQTVPQKLPKGNIVVIDPRNDCNLFNVGGVLENPICTVPDDSLHVLTSVKMHDTVLDGARQITPSGTATVQNLIQTPDEFPLLSRIDGVYVLTADLNRGGFVLRTAFPILTANILATVVGERASAPVIQASQTSESNLRHAPESFYSQDSLPASVFIAAYPLWFYLTLAGMMFIALEWLLYQQRWLD
jgi:hypothetical protein